MYIELKSNRSFIVKLYLPLSILLFALIILMCVGYIVDNKSMKGNGLVLIAFIALELITIFILLSAKFYKGKSYKFFQDKIIVYNKSKFDKEISLDNIESMSYYKFKFRYIITIFAGELNEGSCWRLYLKFADGTKTNIACFSVKDIEKLKEIYPELITIH